MIADTWRDNLHAYIGGIIKDMNAVPSAIGGPGDHAHVLIGLRATHILADVVRQMKRGLVGVDSFSWSARLRLARGICGFYSQSIASRKGGAIHRKSGRASSSKKFRGRVFRDVAIERSRV
jgi:hypothetical protein